MIELAHMGGEAGGASASSLVRVVPPSLLAAAFPVGDWQFWAVTAVFLVAAAWLLKGVVPIPWLSKRAKRKKEIKRVSLTIGGKAPEKEP